MKKELSIAIIVGLFFGLLITVAVFRARSVISRDPPDQLSNITALPVGSDEPTTTPEPPEQTDSTVLKITEPDDETLTTDTTVRISGSSIPNTAIVLLTKEKEFVTSADTVGNFSLVIPLLRGGNVMRIRALPDGQSMVEATRVVVSLPPNSESTDSASPSAIPAQRRVQ